MEPFQTPFGFNDWYTDETRPEGHLAHFQVLGGPRKFHWSEYKRQWFPASIFLPTPVFQEPENKWTARQLLESPPPNITTSAVSVPTHQSSQHNLLYATLSLLTPSPNPDGLVDYYSSQNQQAAVHYPIQLDPTLEMNNESEVIYAARHYIVTPVCRALYYSSASRIISKTEETVIEANVVSRLDMSFSTEISGVRRVFAILEFKRPGAIKLHEWQPVMGQPGKLGPGADNISRQLHKYGYTCDTRYVAVFDGQKLLVMVLGGTRDDWRSDQTLGARPNGAFYRLIVNRDKLKCNLYVWLKEAYNEHLLRWR